MIEDIPRRMVDKMIELFGIVRLQHVSLFLSIGFLCRSLGGKEVVGGHSYQMVQVNMEGDNG